jgi:hypothetical protein
VQDGTQLQIKSAAQNRYLIADQGGGAAILADRSQASSWETFRVCLIDRIVLSMCMLCFVLTKHACISVYVVRRPYAAVENQRDDRRSTSGCTAGNSGASTATAPSWRRPPPHRRGRRRRFRSCAGTATRPECASGHQMGSSCR